MMIISLHEYFDDCFEQLSFVQ